MPKKTKRLILLFVAATFILYNVTNANVVTQNQLVSQAVSREIDRQMLCMAENIYYEAGVESYEGKLAVAQTTLNRANSGKFPSDICSVVHQKTGSTYQFSWVGMNVSKNRNEYVWEECMMIAKKAMSHSVLHREIAKENALYYHADYVSPNWGKRVIAKIGKHIFYKG